MIKVKPGQELNTREILPKVVSEVLREKGYLPYPPGGLSMPASDYYQIVAAVREELRSLGTPFKPGQIETEITSRGYMVSTLGSAPSFGSSEAFPKPSPGVEYWTIYPYWKKKTERPRGGLPEEVITPKGGRELPRWVLPVALGTAGLIGLMIIARRRR